MNANSTSPASFNSASAVRPDILVVDDDASIRGSIEFVLDAEHYDVTFAASVSGGTEALAAKPYDLVVTDLRLGAGSGLDLIKRAKEVDATLPVILMTSYSSLESAIAALRLGASEYIIKPFNNDEFLHACRRAIEERKLRRENATLKRTLRKTRDRKTLVGEHAKVKRVLEMVRRMAASDANVLISGESGTGKELVAQALHYESPRAEGPLVVVNCGAIPSELVEAQLFGHVKGAFTGAVGHNDGLIREADGGTLFLDEVGELPLSMQVKFLRVLEDKQVRAVGGRDVHRVNVRIVAATNKDLKTQIGLGQFREDLFYRLNVLQLDVPPLRERGRDIDLLASHFIELFASRLGKRITGLDREFSDFIRSYDWPGNVRELQNLIERAVILADSEVLAYSDLADGLLPAIPEEVHLEGTENPLSVEGYIKQVVIKFQSTLSEVELAKMLGIGRKALWMRRKRWGLLRHGKESEDSNGNEDTETVAIRNG